MLFDRDRITDFLELSVDMGMRWLVPSEGGEIVGGSLVLLFARKVSDDFSRCSTTQFCSLAYLGDSGRKGMKVQVINARQI